LANIILHNDFITGRNTAHHMDVSTSETDYIPLFRWMEAREGKQIKSGGTKVQNQANIQLIRTYENPSKKFIPVQNCYKNHNEFTYSLGTISPSCQVDTCR
jgi:hypothetical protein